MPTEIVSLTAKDFATLKAEMLEAIPGLSPEWTNLNEGDLGIVLVNLMAGVGDMLAWYIDRYADEAFLPTARTREAVTRLAQLIDYRLSRPVAAVTRLRFTAPGTSGSNRTIPAYTTVQTQGGVQFVTAESAIIFAGETTAEVLAYQGRLVTEAFTGTGASPQTLALTRPNVAQNFLVVTVAGAVWQEDTNTSPFALNGVYEVNVDSDDYATLRFTSLLGSVPPATTTITVAYLETSGASGNVGSGLVNALVTSIPAISGLTVTNITTAAGGAAREGLEAARDRAPRYLRTLGRAVTIQDFVDLVELYPGFAKAQAVNHTGYVELYAAPSTGGALFLPAPDITAVTSPAGGSLAADELFIKVTAVDANGETGTTEFNPVDRAVIDYGTSHTVALNDKLVITWNRREGATAYNIYVGTAAGTTKLEQTAADAGTGVTQSTEVLTLLGTGAPPPSTNTTGLRAANGVDTLRLDLEAYLEDRRLLCTNFAIFNPTYVPVDVTATVTIYENYRQIAVRDAVETALAAYLAFDARAFGDDVPIAALYKTVMDVEGVRSVAFTLPTGDTAVGVGELASLGTMTLTMSGGVSG